MALSSGGYPCKLQPNFQMHGKVLFISIFLLGHADIGKLCFNFVFLNEEKHTDGQTFFFSSGRGGGKRGNGGKGAFLSFFLGGGGAGSGGSCCLEPVVCP